jgi:hypothetical protein
MKKIIIIIVLFSIFLSCQKKEENFSKEMIEKLIVIDNGLPSKYTFLDLYVLTNNNEVLKTNNDYLFLSYNRYYHMKFKCFEDFLNEVLNENFVFDKSSLYKIIHHRSFKLNQEIEKQYSEIGFEEFIKKYSKKTNKKNAEFELNKSIIKENEYSTIVYLLYKNRYDVSSDCARGEDYIRKRKCSFK